MQMPHRSYNDSVFGRVERGTPAAMIPARMSINGCPRPRSTDLPCRIHTKNSDVVFATSNASVIPEDFANDENKTESIVRIASVPWAKLGSFREVHLHRKHHLARQSY